jgi:hypothetical protein
MTVWEAWHERLRPLADAKTVPVAFGVVLRNCPLCILQLSKSLPLVFLVDLMHFVLFLIDPVKGNGGVIDLDLKPTLTAPALFVAPQRG